MLRLNRLAPFVGALVAGLVAGCGQDSGPVVVGAVGPWHLTFLQKARMAIELAAEEVNAAGGIRGRRLVVTFANDSGDAERAAGIAGRFVADRRIVASLGPINSGALLAASRVYDGRLPTVSPISVSPDLSGISEWVFRLMTNDSVFAIAVGATATRLGRRAAIVFDNNSFGRGGAEAFRRHYRGAIVSYDPVESGSPDMEPFVSFYKERRVDLVYVAGVATTGVSFLRERQRQRFAGAVLGSDTWASVIPDSAFGEGAYIAARFSIRDPRSEVQRFAAAFRDRFGVEADGIAAFAYDAAHLLARAMISRGPRRKAIRDYLASLDSTNTWRGVTGPIGFTREGDPTNRSFALMQVRGGSLVLLEGGGGQSIR